MARPRSVGTGMLGLAGLMVVLVVAVAVVIVRAVGDDDDDSGTTAATTSVDLSNRAADLKQTLEASAGSPREFGPPASTDVRRTLRRPRGRDPAGD